MHQTLNLACNTAQTKLKDPTWLALNSTCGKCTQKLIKISNWLTKVHKHTSKAQPGSQQMLKETHQHLKLVGNSSTQLGLQQMHMGTRQRLKLAGNSSTQLGLQQMHMGTRQCLKLAGNSSTWLAANAYGKSQMSQNWLATVCNQSTQKLISLIGLQQCTSTHQRVNLARSKCTQKCISLRLACNSAQAHIKDLT